MKKWLWSLIGMLVLMLLSPWVEWHFGSEDVRDEGQTAFVFDPNWRSQLHNITGQIIEMPSPHYVTNYLESLEWSPQLAIQTYELTEKRVKNWLKKQAELGMQIRIMIENKKYQQFQNTYKKLQSEFSGLQNIQVKSDQHLPTQYLHGKITLVQSGFWLQSANLTHSTFAKNREHLFWSENQGVLVSLWKIFEKDRAWEEIHSTDLHPNLLVCNLNCRELIVDLLSGAQKSITIQTQYLTDPQLFDVIAKKSQSLTFRAIFSATEANEDLPSYFGSHQVRLLKKPYIHTKMILVDDEILLLGSMNLSANSLDNNREFWILLLDQELIQQFLSGFERDWERAGGR